jgi:hypothetical protein
MSLFFKELITFHKADVIEVNQNADFASLSGLENLPKKSLKSEFREYPLLRIQNNFAIKCGYGHDN